MTATTLKEQAMNSATRLKSKVISATRDLTAVTGDVAYTGVGFTPTSLIASADLSTKKSWTLGFADSAKAGQGHYLTDVPQSGPLSDVGATVIIFAQSAANNYQYAIVKSYDADGFTLTWTKVNSPTGTATIRFLCFS